jgi:Ca2+-binding EF-hand superfamily protein
MRKVVWTAAAAAITVACFGATPAVAQGTAVQGTAAQGTHSPDRQQMRARIEKRAEKRFKKLDRNGDGVIDRSEWTRKAKAFDRFDRDHDGTLSPDEFRRLVAARARHRG